MYTCLTYVANKTRNFWCQIVSWCCDVLSCAILIQSLLRKQRISSHCDLELTCLCEQTQQERVVFELIQEWHAQIETFDVSVMFTNAFYIAPLSLGIQGTCASNMNASWEIFFSPPHLPIINHTHCMFIFHMFPSCLSSRFSRDATSMYHIEINIHTCAADAGASNTSTQDVTDPPLQSPPGLIAPPDVISTHGSQTPLTPRIQAGLTATTILSLPRMFTHSWKKE